MSTEVPLLNVQIDGVWMQFPKGTKVIEACSWPTQSFLAKFKEEFAAKSTKSVPPPMPPEYTRDELIAHDVIPAVPAPRGNGHEVMAPAATR